MTEPFRYVLRWNGPRAEYYLGTTRGGLAQWGPKEKAKKITWPEIQRLCKLGNWRLGRDVENESV